MNTITVQPFQTQYDYEEYYITIDGKPIVEYLNDYIKACTHVHIEKMKPFDASGLCPAWSSKVGQNPEQRFIWMLIEREEATNLPILVCEDDLDFSCLVFVVAVRKDASCVYWDKIGLVSHENVIPQDELKSGILCLESYSKDDWIKYGDTIALETVGSELWNTWVSDNWAEELYRRCMNYTLPYYHNDDNIIWIHDTNFVFKRIEYENCVSYYKS